VLFTFPGPACAQSSLDLTMLGLRLSVELEWRSKERWGLWPGKTVTLLHDALTHSSLCLTFIMFKLTRPIHCTR